MRHPHLRALVAVAALLLPLLTVTAAHGLVPGAGQSNTPIAGTVTAASGDVMAGDGANGNRYSDREKSVIAVIAQYAGGDVISFQVSGDRALYVARPGKARERCGYGSPRGGLRTSTAGDLTNLQPGESRDVTGTLECYDGAARRSGFVYSYTQPCLKVTRVESGWEFGTSDIAACPATFSETVKSQPRPAVTVASAAFHITGITPAS